MQGWCRPTRLMQGMVQVLVQVWSAGLVQELVQGMV